jgi:hypothetical protein
MNFKMDEIHVGRDFRKELLPVALDNLANLEPHRLFALIAHDATAERGFWEVTFQDLANAVNHAAWWLENTLGKPEPGSFPTVTYIGAGDIRYYALLLGSIKVGYKVRNQRSRKRRAADSSAHRSCFPQLRTHSQCWKD